MVSIVSGLVVAQAVLQGVQLSLDLINRVFQLGLQLLALTFVLDTSLILSEVSSLASNIASNIATLRSDFQLDDLVVGFTTIEAECVLTAVLGRERPVAFVLVVPVHNWLV